MGEPLMGNKNISVEYASGKAGIIPLPMLTQRNGEKRSCVPMKSVVVYVDWSEPLGCPVRRSSPG
jgi:hypothetical protein